MASWFEYTDKVSNTANIEYGVCVIDHRVHQAEFGLECMQDSASQWAVSCFYCKERWKGCGRHNCGTFGTCVPRRGKYRCECIPGYILDDNLVCEQEH